MKYGTNTDHLFPPDTLLKQQHKNLYWVVVQEWEAASMDALQLPLSPSDTGTQCKDLQVVVFQRLVFPVTAAVP